MCVISRARHPQYLFWWSSKAPVCWSGDFCLLCCCSYALFRPLKLFFFSSTLFRTVSFWTLSFFSWHLDHRLYFIGQLEHTNTWYWNTITKYTWFSITTLQHILNVWRYSSSLSGDLYRSSRLALDHGHHLRNHLSYTITRACDSEAQEIWSRWSCHLFFICKFILFLLQCI
jgi:hypothetical protein